MWGGFSAQQALFEQVAEVAAAIGHGEHHDILFDDLVDDALGFVVDFANLMDADSRQFGRHMASFRHLDKAVHRLFDSTEQFIRPCRRIAQFDKKMQAQEVAFGSRDQQQAAFLHGCRPDSWMWRRMALVSFISFVMLSVISCDILQRLVR